MKRWGYGALWWALAQMAFSQEGQGERYYRNGDNIMMEQFLPLPPLRFRAVPGANSCAPSPPEASCTLTLSRGQRAFFSVPVEALEPRRRWSGPPPAPRPSFYYESRLDHFYWEYQGFDYPLDEALGEDTLSCSHTHWLPPNLEGPELLIPLWTFQDGLPVGEYLSNQEVSRYALGAREVHLRRVGEGVFRIEGMASVGLPPISNRVTDVLGAMEEVDAMEWVFFPGEAAGACSIQFSLDVLPEPPFSLDVESLSWEGARPVKVNGRDFHQYFSSHLFEYFQYGDIP